MNAMTRRDALRNLATLVGGAAAGCTPARLVLHAYDRNFERDDCLTDRTLAAFVETVVPGAGANAAFGPRALADRAYPFAPYRAYFAADLCRRADRVRAGSRFHALSASERRRVVRDGLGADAITRQLYEGAIFLVQIAVYAGIYDDEAGCDLIGFEGANDGLDADEATYPDASSYMPTTRTDDGNYA